MRELTGLLVLLLLSGCAERGLGVNMRQSWLEPATGATTHRLPPYKSYREV